MAEMIQNFLDSGLLDIDDENIFNYLVETAEELSTILIENPDKIISYTLIAIDPTAPIEDPVFDEVEELLKNRWRFLRKRHPDRPKEFLRSIIFQALELASNDNETVVGLIWLTAKSFLPYAKLYGDVDIYRNFIELMGKRFEQDISTSIKINEIPTQKKKDANQNKSELEIKIASMISNRYNGDTIPPEHKPNPSFSNANFPVDPWINEFVPRATGFLLEIMSTIQENTSTTQNQVIKIIRNFVRSMERHSIKTDVLWWKQALYSPRLIQSYRGLPSNLACIIMALDLSDIISPPYPISVDYILRETVRDLLEATDKNSIVTITFAELLQGLVKPDLQPKLRELMDDTAHPKSRTSLLNFLGAFVHGNCPDAEEIKSIVGVNLDDKITLPDFSVWLFCDLQAEKLLQDGED